MKIVEKALPELSCDYPLERIAPVEKILFLDIETTGFTARSSYLYLIGCIYYKDGAFHLIQWFADRYEEETEVLRAFFDFVKNFECLIHYNGNHFDIPYLEQKAAQYEMHAALSSMEGVDIYRRIATLKDFLRLSNAKQKTVEYFLGIARQDLFNGGELIGVYHDYVRQPADSALDMLLLHNADDIQGMVRLLPILAYADLYHEGVRVTKVNANYYRDFQNAARAELVMKLSLPVRLPVAISGYNNGCYFSSSEDSASLKVPLLDAELKYFYANYRDYYYLPAEDTALHKSVASFVDKEHRIQATAATCYTRKHSEYLPEWEPLFLPVFKASYDAKETYFELTEEFKRDRDAFAGYATHVLRMIISAK
ncbi:MAG: ribonuclease H-like domain-containing protein [Lachnospiraceae bacterium]